MNPQVSIPDVDPDFIEADEAIEALHSTLRYVNSTRTPSDAMAILETIYQRGAEAVRYKALTDVIELEFTGARPLLIKALQNDESALVRHEAAFGLGILGRGSDAKCLSDAMLNDDNLMVRHEAAIALATVGDNADLQALTRASRDTRPEVSASAKYAIQSIRLRAARRDAE